MIMAGLTRKEVRDAALAAGYTRQAFRNAYNTQRMVGADKNLALQRIQDSWLKKPVEPVVEGSPAVDPGAVAKSVVRAQNQAIQQQYAQAAQATTPIIEAAEPIIGLARPEKADKLKKPAQKEVGAPIQPEVVAHPEEPVAAVENGVWDPQGILYRPAPVSAPVERVVKPVVGVRTDQYGRGDIWDPQGILGGYNAPVAKAAPKKEGKPVETWDPQGILDKYDAPVVEKAPKKEGTPIGFWDPQGILVRK